MRLYFKYLYIRLYDLYIIMMIQLHNILFNFSFTTLIHATDYCSAWRPPLQMTFFNETFYFLISIDTKCMLSYNECDKLQ